MRFVEAFEAMGYRIPAPRLDWSSEKSDGVCLTLWSKEIDWKSLVMDSRVHAGPIALWQRKPGNRKRIQHIRRALAEFAGWVDVVKIDGTPGERYGAAEPWRPMDRQGYRWRVTFLDEQTGHFRVQALSSP